MNIKNIDKLIAHLESQTHWGFNMAAFISQDLATFRDHSRNPHHCGTVACLAGHIALMETPEDQRLALYEEAWTYYEFITFGANFLEISYSQASELFLYGIDPQEINSHAVDFVHISEAIEVLKTFRDTGKITWKERLNAHR